MNIILIKRAVLRRVGAQDTERPASAPNDDAHTANNPMLAEQGWPGKARLAPKIFDNHRLIGEQAITGLGVSACADLFPPDKSLFPAETRAQEQAISVR